jgi:hypothetical protein
MSTADRADRRRGTMPRTATALAALLATTACACTPRWDPAQAPIPASRVAQLGPDGSLQKDGTITPDGHIVNTSYTVNSPHPSSYDAPDQRGQLVPELDDPTIGDRLSEAGVSWKWYSGGWDAALAGRADSTFQFHHQPFAFFRRYADGTEGRRLQGQRPDRRVRSRVATAGCAVPAVPGRIIGGDCTVHKT